MRLGHLTNGLLVFVHVVEIQPMGFDLHGSYLSFLVMHSIVRHPPKKKHVQYRLNWHLQRVFRNPIR